MTKWTPLFLGEEKKMIERKLLEISLCLNNDENVDPSLFGGRSGIALFFNYYYIYTNDIKYKKKAESLIIESFEYINEGFTTPSFASGIAGILYALGVIKHTVNSEIEFDDTEVIFPFFDFFKIDAEKKISNNMYDYMHGAMGYFILYLQFYTCDKSEKYLLLLTEKLVGAAEKTPFGIRWLSDLNPNLEAHSYDLCLSHGISSIIVILSFVFKKTNNKNIFDSLCKAIHHLLAQKNKNFEQIGAIFPNFESTPESKSKLAWCYGDVGIGYAIYQTGNITKQKQWKQEGINILLSTINRITCPTDYVFDAGLCHGSAGLAHIYNVVCNLTGDIRFENAAKYWYRETLKKAIYSDGLAGYKIRSEESLENEAGFLEGIAGIGLSLLSSISNVTPCWSNALLINIADTEKLTE